MKRNYQIIFLILFFSFLFAEKSEFEKLFNDLQTIEKINKKKDLPFIYNYLSYGGYFAMPSARTSNEGELSLNFSYLPPYRTYGASFQLFSHLELSGNYWIYHNQEDTKLSKHGFGDYADRAANFKLNLLKNLSGFEYLPQIAFGMNDFFGSKRFKSYYIVATKCFEDLHFEASLGFADGRMKGFFGGVAFYPFLDRDFFLKNLIFAAEYDNNDYKHHRAEHRKGRDIKFPINFGIYYQFLDVFQLAFSSIRGKDLAGSVNVHYNLGETKGLLPKLKNPPIYRRDDDQIHIFDSEKNLVKELSSVLQKQGFSLFEAYSFFDKERKRSLFLKITNLCYRKESDIKERIQNILGNLISKDEYKKVLIAVETDGLISYEYTYRTEDLVKYKDNLISDFELDIIAPMKDLSFYPSFYNAKKIYTQHKKIFSLTCMPKFISYFGSTYGKFKYDVGGLFGLDGYLFNQLYYDVQLSYIVYSNSKMIQPRDTLNPSKIINVRTDLVSYYHSNVFRVDRGYFQKNWNLLNGLFAKLSTGLFEVAYGGVATEFLYYPAGSCWAVGLEGALLLKRHYNGIGFTTKIPKYNGRDTIHEHFIGTQYFLDLYYNFKPLDLEFKFSLGQFLAKDKGIKIEMGKNFKSGLTISFWYTFTTAVDYVNGSRYFDKGLCFSFPLDILLNKSSKKRVGYCMSAWLRDIGAKSRTGKDLFPLLYYSRKN